MITTTFVVAMIGAEAADVASDLTICYFVEPSWYMPLSTMLGLGGVVALTSTAIVLITTIRLAGCLFWERGPLARR